MPIDDTQPATLLGMLGAGDALHALTTPTIRLGVTGLARAGKTVFITALVRNLLKEARLPFFAPAAEGRILRAYLEPQPDDNVPRFAYEDHLAALARSPADWPESTRRISQLRITIEYRSTHPFWRQLGARRLHLDIVDYPGEWLIDLPLITKSYQDWSRQAMEAAQMPGRADAAAPFLAFVRPLAATEPEDETKAREGARLFTNYLLAERANGIFEPTLGPGRFLLPGDLDGSPLLTFLPLPTAPGPYHRGTLGSMMERRFEAYKTHVVKPFFRDHFARLDRQIVLVDALSAIDRGGAPLSDLEATLAAVLDCFRTGAHGFLSAFLPRRIDRILLAATKADHVPAASHDRLEAILQDLTRQATVRARLTGAETKAVAVAALRATREAEIKRGSPRPVLIGVPMPGMSFGGVVYDGTAEAAIFPGDLPASLAEARTATRAVSEKDLTVVRFRPRQVAPESATGAAAPWPHIRLDRALDFLIGDRLA